MRTIRRSTRFKRDFKRELSGRFGLTLTAELSALVSLLANDQPLPENFRDHALSANWKGHRDCHVKPDLVLIYRLPDQSTLELVRLGSHSELKI